jgi:WD40 repeat protein
LVACGTADGKIHTVDYELNVSSAEVHVDATRSLSFSPMGTWLASGSKDKHIKLWRPETGRVLILAKASDYVYEVRFSNDGRSLLAADGAGVLTVVDFGKHVDLTGPDEVEKILEETKLE